MKKITIVYIVLFVFTYLVNAQGRIEVTGIVTDELDEPLIGVNVYVVDEPGLGTITDLEGKYKISLPSYQRLTFSYIGFETVEIQITDQKIVNVVMEEASTSILDEVVITGTGAQEKISVTGAITTVDLEEIKSVPTSNLSNVLAGYVPGIMAMTTSGQPGQNVSEFWIRGISTFGAGTGAYVLVDGFERELNEVNIEDIESFSVLKDASATAIYGSKGANGVILITTKRGEAGRIKIEGKVETSYNTRTITPEFVDGMTYANLLNEAAITRNQPAMYQPEELEILRLGLDPDLYPNVDWKNLLLKDGAMSYRANLNLRGGGATSRYFASISYVEEQGMYNTDKTLRDSYNTNANYYRYNYRLNTDMNLTKTTLLKLGISGSLSKRNSPGLGDADVWGQIFGYTAIRTPVMYSNGYVPAVNIGDRTNPWVAATQTGFNENWRNNIQTNVSLDQDLAFITKGLKFSGRFGFDTNNNNNIERRKWPEQWRAERVRGPEGELIFTHISSPSEMFQSSSSGGNRREFLDFIFNYNRNFDGHRFGGALKYTQDAFIRTQNLGADLKNGVASRNQALSGQVTYNWKLRYFMDFNFGYTGSENFALGHQYGFFPAFSTAWNVAEENFVKNNIKWIDMLKVRYSFGKVGNDNLGDNRFPYLYTIERGDNGGSGYQWADYNFDRSYGGMRFTQVASPYVTWEVATKNNLGVDLSLFGDRLIANIDYFKDKREGIYMQRNFLPSMVGLESVPSANVGAVQSQGFDGRIVYNQRVGEVRMTIRGNMTYSKNKILERDEESAVYPYQLQKGYRVDQARGLIAMGLFEDYDDIRNSPTQMFGRYQPGDIKYKDVNGDGVIDGGDVVAIGATRRPNLIYGAGASAQWRGLDVNVHFQGAGKSTFFINGSSVYAFNENLWGNIMKGLVDDNRWISAEISGDPATENPNASYPRLEFGGNSNNFRNSTFWLRNGAYLRLKTIDLGYSIPTKVVNKIHLTNLRVFVVGTNLLTWSSFKLWDPEMASSNGQQYPLTKSITFGLNIKL